MNENEVAQMIAKTLQWAIKQADSPSLIEIEYEGAHTFTLVAVPGNTMRVTVTPDYGAEL